MATKYFALLTNIGAAKLANATALGDQVEITQMAVGDGNGTLPTPNPAQTALTHELRRAQLNMLTIDPVNTNQVIAEQVIPEDVGGWWIREIGLFDKAGDMIAVANCAETYKPQLQEGSGRVQVIRVILIVSSTEAVTLKIDPSVVLATRKYVDDAVIEIKAYTDEVMSGHVKAVDPHTQYAPKANPTFTGTPKAPTPTAGNNTTQLATTAFVQAALVALINGAPSTLDTLKEIAAAINNDPNFSTTINNALEGKQPLDNTLTALSGKSVEALLEYLHLAEAGNTSGKLALIGNAKTDNDKCAVIVKTGSNANGKYRIWSDGSIDMWGNGIANVNGDALVNYPIALPAAAQNVTTTPLVLSTGTNRPTTSVMVVTDLTTATKATFIVKRSDGTTSADGFYWSVNYAAF
ncbi:phage tail protein [Salmonella enterica subsp. houtenae str. CFSAN000557]|nr:phage tail protein [Salmonella enterica subsp. houtenae str. CFSAN000557]